MLTTRHPVRESAFITFLSVLQAGRRFGSLYFVVRRLLEGIREILQSQPGRVHTISASAYVFQVKYTGSE